jgi:hypothetical protein
MNDHWIGLTNDHINFFWIRLDCIQLQKFPVDWYYGMVLKYRMFKRGPNSFFFVHIWKIYKNVFFIQFWCRYFLWIDYTESFRMSVIRFPLPLTVSIINSTETGHKCPIPKFDLGSQCRKWTIFYRKETKYCTNSDILNVWRFTQFIFWMFEDLHNLHFECLKIYTIYILNVWRFTQFIFWMFEDLHNLYFECLKIYTIYIFDKIDMFFLWIDCFIIFSMFKIQWVQQITVSSILLFSTCYCVQ